MLDNTLNRIKIYIDSKGISIRMFEQSVGMSNGSFASQLKNNKTIGVDKLENILHVYSDINVEWLLTGQGSMLKTDTYNNVSPPPPATPSESNNAQIERIYKDLLKENEAKLEKKDAKIEALNREVGALTKDLEARDLKIEELKMRIDGREMQIGMLQEQLNTAKQALEQEQAVKKTPKPYNTEPLPSLMAAEPQVEYQKKK